MPLKIGSRWRGKKTCTCQTRILGFQMVIPFASGNFHETRHFLLAAMQATTTFEFEYDALIDRNKTELKKAIFLDETDVTTV